MEGEAVWLNKSSESSMPELPQPTTRTFFPLNLSPHLYWHA